MKHKFLFPASAALALAFGLTPMPSPARTSVANPRGEATYAELLGAWRTPGRISSAACANCHGPDGLELAIYDFDDATIRRRALPHLDPAVAEHVVQFIHAVRSRYAISKLLDPLRDRPLQPGGRLLPGQTPLERDFAFGRSLATILPTLTGAPVKDLKMAEKAADELLAVDPWQLPIGIPLNRFSEDSFHGTDHASLAHWLPDVPRQATPGDLALYYQRQDVYLADPTERKLWQMIDGFAQLTKPINDTGIALIAQDKYESLMLLQHRVRQALLGHVIKPTPVTMADWPEPVAPNPMWQVGEEARKFQEAGPAALGLDPELLAKKQGGPSFQDQIRDLQSSWFWLGWLFDQGLERTSNGHPPVARGDWLALALWNGGPYPIHISFALARKQLVVNRLPGAWKGMPDRKRTEWNYLGERIGGRYISDMPVEAKHRRLYCRFTANCFRMSLLQMIEEWERTKIVWYRKSALLDARALTEFIGKYDPADPEEAKRLYARCQTAVAACTERI